MATRLFVQKLIKTDNEETIKRCIMGHLSWQSIGKFLKGSS